MKNRNYIIFGSLITIILLWVGSWYYIDNKFPNNGENFLSDRGTFGDKFGFINSLFSGLALTGIIISIYFQQIELKLQRKELIETRKEFKDQNFQTTFFNLLKTQRQLAEEINCNIYYLRNYDKELSKNIQGRQFFIESKREMNKIKEALENGDFHNYIRWNDILEHSSEDLEPQSSEEAEVLTYKRKLAFTFHNYKINNDLFKDYNNADEIKKAKIIYNIFFEKYRFVIGHYYRHLYHIFNFLEKYEEEHNKENETSSDILNFANFIQAQMSTPEMFLLYYNSLKFTKMKTLVIKYKILENLVVKDLISEKHKIDEIDLS